MRWSTKVSRSTGGETDSILRSFSPTHTFTSTNLYNILCPSTSLSPTSDPVRVLLHSLRWTSQASYTLKLSPRWFLPGWSPLPLLSSVPLRSVHGFGSYRRTSPRGLRLSPLVLCTPPLLSPSQTLLCLMQCQSFVEGGL